jgi:arylsulfatase
MEGALRVPLIIRWPNKIPAGKVTNEIIHVVDLFPTLAQIAKLEVPKDRIIDGIDQSQFLLGKQEKSNREGFVYYIKTELRAAK